MLLENITRVYILIDFFKLERFPVAICLPYADVNSTSIGAYRMESFVAWN